MRRPTRNGAVVALAVAVVVLGAQVILHLLSTLLTATVYASSGPGDFLLNIALPSYLVSVILSWLPVVIGVFLTLWLLAPISSGLRLGQVLGRSLLAVAGATVVVFLAYLGAGLLSQVSSSEGMVFGWASAIIGSVVSGMSSLFGYTIFNALNSAIGLGPLILLACLLVWAWMRERPAQGVTPAPTAEV